MEASVKNIPIPPPNNKAYNKNIRESFIKRRVNTLMWYNKQIKKYNGFLPTSSQLFKKIYKN